MEKLTLQLNHIPDNWQALLQYLASLDFVDAIEFKGKTIAKKNEPAEKKGISKPDYDLDKILKERNMTREEWDEIQRTIAKGDEKPVQRVCAE
ncbi:MAG: hypothetical protein AAB316_23950, partial [Bacteroidota bacterium]